MRMPLLPCQLWIGGEREAMRRVHRRVLDSKVRLDRERTADGLDRLVLLSRKELGSSQRPVPHRIARVKLDTLLGMPKRHLDFCIGGRHRVQERARIARPQRGGR